MVSHRMLSIKTPPFPIQNSDNRKKKEILTTVLCEISNHTIIFVTTLLNKTKKNFTTLLYKRTLEVN